MKQCPKCQQCNTQVVKYNQGQFSVPKAPMDFISMDLIGEFHPPTAEGYKYALNSHMHVDRIHLVHPCQE